MVQKSLRIGTISGHSPGVGDYTAGAVLSIALNKNYLAIDGNVKELFLELQEEKN